MMMGYYIPYMSMSAFKGLEKESRTKIAPCRTLSTKQNISEERANNSVFIRPPTDRSLTEQPPIPFSASVNVVLVVAGRAPEDDVRHAAASDSGRAPTPPTPPHFGSFADDFAVFRGDREEGKRWWRRPLPLSRQREVRSLALMFTYVRDGKRPLDDAGTVTQNADCNI